MKHARSDYDRIQDPDNKIPADEPVFLLRGQDRYAAHIVRVYAALVQDEGADPAFVALCRQQADAMDAWPPKKDPDL